MRDIFETMLNMSITGAVVIIVVAFVRFILKDAPKKYSYLLWSVVAFRLCCPFSFRSFISIFNINPIQNASEVVTDSSTMNYIGTPTIFNQSVSQEMASDIVGGADETTATLVASSPFDKFIDFIPYLWLIGFCALLLYGVISYVKLKKQLSTATRFEKNIYQSEKIATPFILGIIKPKIFIPYGIDENCFDYVISHEKYHLKRNDNVIKAFAFVLLALHWFNPLCWLAFYLMNEDMEMSCDEWVLAHNEGIKKEYSSALLSFATNKKFPSPSPLCFGESSAKSRIKNILKYHKPELLISVLAIILCVVVVLVCVSNPGESFSNSINDIEYVSAYQSGGDKIGKIETVENNSIGDNFNSSTYLTNDYFFYTSYDRYSDFGDGCKVMKYDLHTAKVEPITKSFYCGGAYNMLVLNNMLYFTAYAETGATDDEGILPGGFCLFEYNIANDEMKRIYATPNTLDYVQPFVCNNKLYYIASTATQERNNVHYNLYSYDNGTSRLINEHSEYNLIDVEIDGVNATIYGESSNGIYTVTEISDNNAVISLKMNDPNYSSPTKYDYRSFGEWKITETQEQSTEDETESDDCGYEYSVKFHISNGTDTYNLADAAYMYYYF